GCARSSRSTPDKRPSRPHSTAPRRAARTPWEYYGTGVDRMLEQLTDLSCIGLLCGLRSQGGGGMLQSRLIELICRRGIRPDAAADHQRLIERQACEPGAELAGGLITIQVAEGPQMGFLHRVLGRGRIP